MPDFEKGLIDILETIQDAIPSGIADKKPDAYTIMRILASGKKPARTLKKLLKSTDKALLKNTAEALSLNVGENPAKAELEAGIYQFIMEHKIAKAAFGHSNGDLFDFIFDIHEEGDFIVPDDYELLNLAPGLMAYHLISAWIDEDGNLILSLPKEIARHFEEHVEETRSMLNKVFADISEAAAAAVELYGAIPFNAFMDMLHDYGITDMPHDLAYSSLEELLAQEGAEDGVYKLDGEYLVHAWLTEDDEAELLDECKGRVKAVPRKVFPKDGFLEFADPAYTDLPQPWAKLREFIEQDLPWLCASGLDFESLFVEFRGIIKLNYPLKEYMELFYEIGIDFQELDRANVFVKLIQDIHNSTRLWGNCGFTPLELAKEHIGAASSAMQMPSSKESPGRNSPCPCGSGKKYKYCCGAPQN